MRQRNLTFFLTVMTFLCVLSIRSSANATVMLGLTLEDLVGRADRIFVGKVVKSESKWARTPKPRIVTDTTFEVTENIEGTAIGDLITVREYGGKVGHLGMKVFGSVQFSVGEETLIFTESRRGHRFVVGMRQGVFSIERDAHGERFTRQSLDGIQLNRITKEGMSPLKKPLIKPIHRLSLFMKEIQTTVTACRARQDRCIPSIRSGQN